MIQATAQGKETLPDGTPVQVPIELQTAWLIDRWGVGLMGPEPDFRMVVRASKALAVHRAFERDIKDRSDDDWATIRDALAKIQGWQA
jgi:hypothetical protein